jgi:hypothetical protein
MPVHVLGEDVAKLEIQIVEVKPHQSLEQH